MDKKEFLAFQSRINRELLNHPIITHNAYTEWFRKGEQTEAQIKAFIVQFSVFSNLFLVAQLQKMIQADTLEGMRVSKEILANEIGVMFHSSREKTNLPDSDIDPEIVSTEGSVQRGTFRFEAGHFEWLYQIARRLGLGFHEIGKRKFGIASTLFFCDELARLYASDNYVVSQAASYAIENWAAAGFWKDLIAGFTLYNQRTHSNLPLGFFIWHDRLEGQHALHTQEELESYYLQSSMDEDLFIRCGNEILNAVAVFWNGLL